MALLTLDEAALVLGTVPADDDQLQGFIDSATPVIEDIVGPVVSAAVTKTFDGGLQFVTLPSPAASITSVTEDGTTTSNYVADLAAGIVYAGTSRMSRYFNTGTQNIVVTYTVGNATVPANVKQAAIELVRYWWQRGRQGNRPAFGDTEQDEVYTPGGFAVPRFVYELCAPNPRLPGFA